MSVAGAHHDLVVFLARLGASVSRRKAQGHRSECGCRHNHFARHPRLLLVLTSRNVSSTYPRARRPKDSRPVGLDRNVCAVAECDRQPLPSRQFALRADAPRKFGLAIGFVPSPSLPVEPQAQSRHQYRGRRYDCAVRRQIHSPLPSRQHQSTTFLVLQGEAA